MVSENKKRITITVSKEMAEKLEMYSTKMGVTVSGMCAQFVGQCIMTYDKSFEIVDRMGEKVVEEMKK